MQLVESNKLITLLNDWIMSDWIIYGIETPFD